MVLTSKLVTMATNGKGIMNAMDINVFSLNLINFNTRLHNQRESVDSDADKSIQNQQIHVDFTNTSPLCCISALIA